MTTGSKSNHDAASEQLMFVSGYVYRLLCAKARTLGIRWSGLMVLVDLDLLGPTRQRALVEIEQVRGSTMTVLLQEPINNSPVIGPAAGCQITIFWRAVVAHSEGR